MEPFVDARSSGDQDQSIARLLETGMYSDFTITCGSDSYAVHKSIVCTQSPYFAAACDGESKEAKSTEINLSDDDPVVVRMMIRYLYHKNYVPPEAPTVPKSGNDSTQQPNQELHPAKKQCGQGSISLEGSPSRNTFASLGSPAQILDSTPTQSGGRGRGRKSVNRRGGRAWPTPPPRVAPEPDSPPPPPPPSNLILHVKVHALGDKYSIGGLRHLAVSKFMNETVHHHHSESFLLAAKHVYTGTVEQDGGMRMAVLGTIQANPDLLENQELQRIIMDTRLGVDLLLTLTAFERAELKRWASSL